MGKKGKAERKPKQRAEQQAPRPGQDAFGEAGERSAYTGQAQRGDAFGESGERSAQPGRAQQQQSGRGQQQQQQQRAKRPGQPQQPEM
jgi:hypothetical protein